jgi:hypothetical protein
MRARWRGSAHRSSEIEAVPGPACAPHCQLGFKLAKVSDVFWRERANPGADVMITRRAFTAALSLTGLTAAGFSPLRLITARWRRRIRRRQAGSCRTWRSARHLR